MGSSYAAGWEGWVQVRERERAREADMKRKWGEAKKGASEGKEL